MVSKEVEVKYIIEYNSFLDGYFKMGYRDKYGKLVVYFHYFDTKQDAIDCLSICEKGSGHFKIVEVYV